jgi:hypothetical protein
VTAQIVPPAVEMPAVLLSRIARWIRTRRSRARFNELGASIPTQSSADCITIMSEFDFSAHTAAFSRGREADPAGAINADVFRGLQVD